ncbi:exonuclease SbcCD subunit D [Candidatus Woesearchaeota archaeon]|nr:exonuclease SbcCD subunit D [Candidatus Woesearchaeota archaeon]
MKFAHIADCHIGSWRDPKLRDASTIAFLRAMDVCIEKKVDFILIAGDLFNTSLPAIDRLKEVVIKLRELKDKEVPVYIIPGSHDFSPSGKTMLDVLEEARLFVNVVKGDVVDDKLKLKFTVDAKTGAKITGMLGKKGMLEKNYYENLHLAELENEPGYKIFMFHTAISELKPKELEKMDSSPVSLLPKGFDYYAGGHVHIVKEQSLEGYQKIVYPGALFPNNFSEIERFGNGGFYIVEDGELSYEPVVVHNVFSIFVDCNYKIPEQIQSDILAKIKNQEFNNTIVTIRLSGLLDSGKVSDIDFKEIFKQIYDKSAYFVMKNTSGLKTTDFEEINVELRNVEELERSLIKEHSGKVELNDDEAEFTLAVMGVLDTEKAEGERIVDFQSRIKKDINSLLKEPL